MDRYDGKPFLRLLECYVLDVIGHLDDSQRQTLERMEPKLTELYGIHGTWSEIVSEQMDFPSTLPDKIREVWERALAVGGEAQVAVDPNEFARAFVDQNFQAR